MKRFGSLVTATLWGRDRNGQESPRERRVCSTFRSAELWAQSVLAPVETTRDCYHRDRGRAPYVDLVEHQRSRHGGRRSKHVLTGAMRTVESPLVVVQSVGELGYW